MACSNPSNSRFPPPSTSGAVEIASSSSSPAARPWRIGQRPPGNPTVELARLHQRGVEPINERGSPHSDGADIGAVGQHNQPAGGWVGTARRGQHQYMLRPRPAVIY